MTSIEWVKNPDGTQGITVNSKSGCLNHTPEGLCLGGLFPCYAFDLANTRLKQRYLANTNLVEPRISYRVVGGDIEYSPYKDPFYPRWWPERLDKIRAIKKPTGIFLDDMSDWMGDYWPEEQTRHELQVMRDCPQHRFYTLTKQPQNLIKFSPSPENCWVGVTVTSPFMFYKACEFLGQIDAPVVYLSIEPLLQEIKIPNAAVFNDYGISWLIIGACTGTAKEVSHLFDKYLQLTPMQWGNNWTLQPRIEWVQEIVSAADKAGVKVFLKDNLKPLLTQTELAPFVEYPWAFRNTRVRQGLPSGR